MKRSIVLGTASLLVMWPLAAGAQEPAQMIVGRWVCWGDTAGGLVSGQMIYKADGTAQSLLVIGSGEGSEALETILRTKQTWRIPGDGTLRERINDVEVLSLKMDGHDVEGIDLTSLGDELMQEELSSASLEITSNSMTMIDAEGTRTACTR